jgi:hypothetical protein
MDKWRRKASRRAHLRGFLILLGVNVCLILGGTGCGTGPMNISERSYLGACNGDCRVYYRVTITGKTELGACEFRQGWFPASAVDALFGDVSADTAKQQTVRDELRRQIDEALLLANKNYLARAVDPKATSEDLQKCLDAIRRVRLTAQDSAEGLDGAVVMEYQPNRDLVIRHSDEKLVLVLSSNPDEIITQLAQLSESERTEETINKFVEVLAFRENRDREKATEEKVAASSKLNVRAADNSGFDGVISGRLTDLTAALEKGETDRDKLVGRVTGLINTLRVVDENQGGQP